MLPHGAWVASSPLLLLRPCVHGVKVLAVIIITVTRGQPRHVFLSRSHRTLRGIRREEGTYAGAQMEVLCSGKCFCSLSSLESITDRMLQFQKKEEKLKKI